MQPCEVGLGGSLSPLGPYNSKKVKRRCQHCFHLIQQDAFNCSLTLLQPLLISLQ